MQNVLGIFVGILLAAVGSAVAADAKTDQPEQILVTASLKDTGKAPQEELQRWSRDAEHNPLGDSPYCLKFASGCWTCGIAHHRGKTYEVFLTFPARKALNPESSHRAKHTARSPRLMVAVRVQLRHTARRA